MIDQFSAVQANESAEIETLDTHIATTSSGTVHVFRHGHSQQNEQWLQSINWTVG
jgi:hypothetical protein